MLSHRRADWWRLVLLIPLAGGLFVVEESVTASAQVHAVLQVAILLMTIGLMALWVRSDERAATRDAVARLVVLDMLDVNTPEAAPVPQHAGEVRHVRIPVSNP